MPEATLETIAKSVEEIGGKISGTQEQVTKANEELVGLKTFQKNAIETIDALKAQIKAMSSQVFDSQGNYKGFLPSRKHAEMAGHYALYLMGQKASEDYLQKANVDTTAATTVIPAPIASMILDLVQGRYGRFRQNCRIWPGTPATIPTQTADTSWTVPGEATATGESRPTLSYVGLTYKEWVGMAYLTLEADADSIVPLGELLIRSFARALGKTEDSTGFLGDGQAGATHYGYTGVFYGIGAAGKRETANAALIDTVVNDILNLIALLPEDYEDSAAFYCHRTIWAVLMGVKDAGGNQIGVTDRLSGQRTVFGFPVVTSSVLTASSAVSAGEEFLYFGSLQDSATIAEKASFNVRTSDDYKFAERMRTFLATQRKAFQTYNKGDGSNPGAVVSLALKS